MGSKDHENEGLVLRRVRWLAALLALATCAGLLVFAPAANAAMGDWGQSTSGGNQRACPSTSCAVRTYVAAGTRVKMYCWTDAGWSGNSPRWFYTQTPTGDHYGWMHASVVQKQASVPACTSRSRGATRSYNAAADGGQCTWWAYSQFHRFAGVYPALTGDARNWDNSARALGWTVVLDAQVSSIVVFEPGVQGALSTGHVAWVEDVAQHADGRYVLVSEYNGSAGWGRLDYRWVKDVPGMSYVLAPNR